ncbi:MAG: T9SS type A sorting domain-containing protein [Bacteroidales bacterium]|nr:T9SS type A sorting domain-containing protein [Bacteroidales bacterium]
MKKLLLLAIAIVVYAGSVSAQTVPSHDKYVKMGSTIKWYEAYQNWQPGTPLYNGDPEAAASEQFFISRVKPRKRFTFTATQVKESLDPERKVLWWCPINESSWNALPSYFFNGEAYSMWSYTDTYGNWTAPLIQVPAAFLDVCHKNGVRSGCVASVPFGAGPSPNDGGHGSNINALVTGGYEKLLKYLRYYGVDGIGFNSEFSWSLLKPVDFKNMMGDCYANAESYGVPFNNAWYSFTANDGSYGDYSVLNSGCVQWFHYNGKKVSDAYFLNYNWGSSQLSTSQSTAEGQGRSGYDVYGGMDFQGRSAASWVALQDYKVSFGIWGAHNTNMIFINQGENGSTPVQKQLTYQKISENVFTGASYNPVNTPPVTNLLCHTSKSTTFHGFSSFITARSTLTPQDGGDLSTDPFVTYFNMGNGQFWKDNGETTYDGVWYNLGMQDYLPTWRWWWTKSFMGKNASDATTDMEAVFNWEDSWYGGTSLEIRGETDKAYLQLFKTKYPTNATGDFLTIRYKVLSGTGKISWACSVESAPKSEVSEVIANVLASTEIGKWVEKQYPINSSRNGIDLYNDVISLLGLKFENTSSDFKVLIGEIALTRGKPGTIAAPSAPKILSSEVLSYNYKGADVKVVFDMTDYDTKAAGRKPYETIYNSDVNTWFYKIYVRQTGGEPKLCTSTTSWASYVVAAPYDADLGGKIQVGVSAVSIDGRSESTIAWGQEMSLPTPVIIEGTEVDKPVIKPNEEFSVKFVDPNHPTANWTIINSATGETIKTVNNASGVTTSLPEVGMYDVKITSGANEAYTRGLIQISPESTGTMPKIETLTVDKTTANTNEKINLSYVAARLGEGKVSRSVKVDDPYMLRFPSLKATAPYTYMMWFKTESISHDTQGTNLISKTSFTDVWPHDNWGDFWVQIRPKVVAHSVSYTPANEHAENEISFNVYGWDAHDVPRDGMMSTGYSVNLDQWTHLAITLDTDGSEKMYFNGRLVASSKDYEVVNNGQRMNGDVYIGGAGVYKAGFTGWIDDFQVWDRVLTDSEVKTAMNGYATGATIPSGLLGYWDFETLESDGESFANRGTAGATKYAQYVEKITGDGPAYCETRAVNNEQLGMPILPGSLEVKTTAKWDVAPGTLSETGGTVAAGTAKVSYSAEGQYTPKLTLENMWGNDSKTIDFITITAESGLEDAVVEEMGVYPNPFTDFVNIMFTQEGVYTAQIVALDGRLIESKVMSVSANEGVRIDINGESGAYILRILNEKGVAVRTMKIIKK